MDRRLFVRKSAIGFTFPFLPSFFFKNSLSDNRSLDVLTRELSGLIQANTLGSLQRLSISHIYSPDRTTWPSLVSIAQQDFSLLAHILGDRLTFDFPSLLRVSQPDSFGSFSTRVSDNEVAIVWQALARINVPPSTPLCTFILTGSKGVMRLNLTDSGYQIVDFQGKTVAKNKSQNPRRLPA